MSPRGFRREDIVGLLADLEARKATLGVALDIQIVGGAALLLHGLIDRATGDIDARYASAATVEQVAREMAVEFSLHADWINSRAMAFSRKMRRGWPPLVALRQPSNWQICLHLPP